MASNPATTLASTLQSASIKRYPSPHHDINPSTAASTKTPGTATLHSPTASIHSSPSSSSSSIAIFPQPRRTTLPPLPDLRFEQSYLASIQHADTWHRIAYITLRDQMLMPLAQGVGWNLALFGWRYWNKGVQLGGRSLGSRVRRWWWGVNNWDVPPQKEAGQTWTRTLASEIEDVRHNSHVGAFWEFMERG